MDSTESIKGQSKILFSRDGGNSWATVATYNDRRFLTLLSNSDVSYLAAPTLQKTTTTDENGQPEERTNRTFPFSSDGGKTWNSQNLPGGMVISLPFVISLSGTANANRLFIVGGSGSDIEQSPDHFLSWNYQWPQPFTYAPTGRLGKELTSLSAAKDGSTIWAVGRSGVYLKGTSSDSYPQVSSARGRHSGDDVILEFKLRPELSKSVVERIDVSIVAARHTALNLQARVEVPRQAGDPWKYVFKAGSAGVHAGDEITFRILTTFRYEVPPSL